MLYSLENKYVKIAVDSLGAELKSLFSRENNRENMWNGDPAYWKRRSPILFPVVGRLKEQKYRYNGKLYEMSQHGFARDKEFKLFEKEKNKITFLLCDDESTYQIYPFRFNLFIEYELLDKKVIVRWKVINTDNKLIYFSIGAHPAFICPSAPAEKICHLQFDTAGPLTYKLLNSDSLMENTEYNLSLENNIWSFTKDVFADDALVFEDYQIKEVAMLDNEDKPYLTMHFAAPVVGIWSPAHKNAPFICIEPWYGRCDAVNYSGELRNREYGNSLPGGAAFSTKYEIELG
ncbi:aldose 1-epimerase family protein [Pectinatus sottacetonis]|uniref:aldose 1-epimerase family protein n=1 Tax=Pectinatus sottacetonis TaxID=1002795 RepID=UPI0018C67CA2|nr:aldose 1-epimerase family protein [Pectinatus sottacetonis]